MASKQTPFIDLHKELGAKIVEFAGYDMPIQYSGIVDEHKRVRTAAGVFDVSHMGEVDVLGPGALEFVQRLTVNDAARLSEGRVQYSAMCYDDGGIVDDLLVYNLGTHFMLVINASNIAKDLEWMRSHAGADVRIVDRSDETALLAVQGPQSLNILRGLTDVDLEALQYYHCVRGTLAGVPMIISRTGYTGELGYELYFAADPRLARRVWESIMKAGGLHGIGPAGLGARDTLRLEMGFCLYGNDIDKTTHPLEAGLGWITKLDKGDFVGRDAIRRAKESGLGRKLVGFVLSDRAFPRHGYTLTSHGAEIGVVTSGTFSPILEQGIGMGYVRPEFAAKGSSFDVRIRDKAVPATVVQLPFVKK